MKQKTINQIGIVIGGTAKLHFWDGDTGDIPMNRCFLPNDRVTPKNILRCVNDGGFGCQKILSASMDIYIRYDDGCMDYDRTIDVGNPIHTKYFMGWKELRKQGIKI